MTSIIYYFILGLLSAVLMYGVARSKMISVITFFFFPAALPLFLLSYAYLWLNSGDDE
ncbi:MAG: hypothetical protein NUV65_03550 [Candidatus Roizmanbacteria bacterium]|nr:hypothetical protein [Candidatus Roizmanbacteria bacterium]